MGSASRDAVVAAKLALSRQSGVTLETGEQLLSAGRDIAGSSQLRALLADPSVEASEKSGLIGRIFGSLSPAAASLLGSVVSDRWSSPDQLLDGIEEVGIRAIASSAGPQSDLEAELFAAAQAVASDPDLELAVGSTLAEPSVKAAIVDRLFGSKLSASGVAIVRHLVQSPRGRRIGALLATAAAIVADEGGRFVATVTAAAPLTDAQLTRLSGALSAQYGGEPRIQVIVDPSIVGGLRVQVRDEVVDGTVAARLSDLRLQLAG